MSWVNSVTLEGSYRGIIQGTVLANKVGRRWTHSTLLGINALLFGVVMVIIPYQVKFMFDVILPCLFMSYVAQCFSSVHH